MIFKNYPVWIDSPNLKQQHNFDYGMPAPLKEILFRALGNPFILFQIRDCMIHLLDKFQLFIVEQPIISIIVILDESEFLKLEFQINEKTENLTELISYWLNEQVAIYGYQLGRNWPSISTMVLKNDQNFQIQNNDFSELDYLKHKKLFNLSNFLQRQIFHESPDKPRFWIRFPKKGKKGSHSMGLEVIVPIKLQTGDNRRIFVNINGKTILGRNYLSRLNSSFLNKLMLLSDQHAELAVTNNYLYEKSKNLKKSLEEYDIDQLWIRHIGSHESWLYHKKWTSISRNKWEPIVPGDRVVLGRVVEEKIKLL